MQFKVLPRTEKYRNHTPHLQFKVLPSTKNQEKLCGGLKSYRGPRTNKKRHPCGLYLDVKYRNHTPCRQFKVLPRAKSQKTASGRPLLGRFVKPRRSNNHSDGVIKALRRRNSASPTAPPSPPAVRKHMNLTQCEGVIRTPLLEYNGFSVKKKSEETLLRYSARSLTRQYPLESAAE